MQHPPFIDLATKLNATPAQVVFAFARAKGMLPLTGTTSAEHIKQDLASLDLVLPLNLVEELESIAG